MVERIYRCTKGHTFIKEFASETETAENGTVSCPVKVEFYDDNGPGAMVTTSCMQEAHALNLPRF